MITDKDIQQSRNIIQRLIKDGNIIMADKKYADFFLKKAEESLQTAQCLFDLSSNQKKKELLNLASNYDGFLWVINSGYYAMFYAATALLAHFNHRIRGEQGIHMLTYHALVYYFLDNDRKLEKHFLEHYQQAEQEATEILQLAEQQAREKIGNVKSEIQKRRIFTYEMGSIAEKSKAETSLQRAKEFITLVKEMVFT